MAFQVGDEFESFCSFEEKLLAHNEQISVTTYILDSKTIENARKKGLKRMLEPELKYYMIKYACVRGGKDFKRRGKGKRESRYV